MSTYGNSSYLILSIRGDINPYVFGTLGEESLKALHIRVILKLNTSLYVFQKFELPIFFKGVTMSFSIYEIPKPASDEDVTKYTEIRLSTLSTNPEAFGSTYARESAFTREQWIARVNTNGRQTFVAINNDNDNWIGVISVLYPEMLIGGPKSTPYPAEISAAEEKGELDVMVIVGMWVRPGYRKRGVAQMLVQHTLEAVRRHFTSKPNRETEPVGEQNPRRQTILLRVKNDNEAAYSLYENNGFRKDAGGEESISSDDDDDESWMVYIVE